MRKASLFSASFLRPHRLNKFLPCQSVQRFSRPQQTVRVSDARIRLSFRPQGARQHRDSQTSESSGPPVRSIQSDDWRRPAPLSPWKYS